MDVTVCSVRISKEGISQSLKATISGFGVGRHGKIVVSSFEEISRSDIASAEVLRRSKKRDVDHLDMVGR